MTNTVYKFIGVGIGPFNLGLAALSAPLHCKALFFDKAPEFNWHPGLMLDDATLQVPFMADLVTMADPASPYSFLNFMKETNRIYKFYIRENFFILRREYNEYCRWASRKLENCLFGHEVLNVEFEDSLYKLSIRKCDTGEVDTYYAEKLVLGTGTQPYIPEDIRQKQFERVYHTSSYLYQKDEILKQPSVTIVGSGQSAAEILQDLLPHTRNGLHLNWITRSVRFFPLENHSRLTLELTSPEYVDYFHSLPESRRLDLLKSQSNLYKGINYDLINQIYNSLYAMEVADGKVNVSLVANSELKDISFADDLYSLEFLKVEQQKSFSIDTSCVIMATGYKYREPEFLKNIEQRINRRNDGLMNVARNYTIDKGESEIYVQNAELHTHGLATPDLGMGAYRNAFILNEILGREVYKVEDKIAFQTFDVGQITNRIWLRKDKQFRPELISL